MHRPSRLIERPAPRASAAALAAFLALGVGSCTTPAPETPRADAGESAPEVTEWMAEPAILVFSKTEGWRHNEGIAGADRFFADLASARGWGLFTTANAGVFNPDSLARFKLVIFNNVTGDALTESQQAAFETWIQSGGAWIGLHGSGDASQKAWTWYQEKVIGPRFIGHIMGPQFQMATIRQIAPTHPVLAGVNDAFELEDEWYSFDAVPQAFGMTAIAGLNESTYSPRNEVVPDWPEDLRMGDQPSDHPMVWSQCLGEGRLVYSAIGHTQFVYDNPDYARLLENAVDWTMRQSDPAGDGCNQ